MTFISSSNKIGHLFKYICPKHKSNKSVIWGPTIWNSLHLIGENYPQKPTKNKIIACKQFINGLPYMLPCGECGYNLLQFINSNNINNICKSRKNLRKFFVDSHNNINRQLNKSIWTTTEAEDYYSSIPCCLSNNNTWTNSKTL